MDHIALLRPARLSRRYHPYQLQRCSHRLRMVDATDRGAIRFRGVHSIYVLFCAMHIPWHVLVVVTKAAMFLGQGNPQICCYGSLRCASAVQIVLDTLIHDVDKLGLVYKDTWITMQKDSALHVESLASFMQNVHLSVQPEQSAPEEGSLSGTSSSSAPSASSAVAFFLRGPPPPRTARFTRNPPRSAGGTEIRRQIK